MQWTTHTSGSARHAGCRSDIDDARFPRVAWWIVTRGRIAASVHRDGVAPNGSVLGTGVRSPYRTRLHSVPTFRTHRAATAPRTDGAA